MLGEILRHKRGEVARTRARMPLDRVAELAARAPEPAGFTACLRERYQESGPPGQRQPALIAEIKKASPSKGLIRADFDPEDIARAYRRGGAAALSVLTDEHYFQGRTDFLPLARQASGLPVLRKDFIIDEYQIYESRALGADALLLIVAALEDERLADLLKLTRELGMDALVEVHTLPELGRAVEAGAELIGINNRDLSTFRTNLETTLQLASEVPKDRFLVSESGINSHEDVRRLGARGAGAVLVGEALMRQPDVELAARGLIGAGA